MSDEPTKTSDLTNDLLANPFGAATTPAPTTPAATPEAQPANQPTLTPEQTAQAEELAKQIDVKNTDAVMNYGASAQKQLGQFSQTMLDKVQSQDTGEIGDALTSLMARLNEANPDELQAENNNVFKKIFGKVRRSIFEITAKYQKKSARKSTPSAPGWRSPSKAC